MLLLTRDWANFYWINYLIMCNVRLRLIKSDLQGNKHGENGRQFCCCCSFSLPCASHVLTLIYHFLCSKEFQLLYLIFSQFPHVYTYCMKITYHIFSIFTFPCVYSSELQSYQNQIISPWTYCIIMNYLHHHEINQKALASKYWPNYMEKNR